MGSVVTEEFSSGFVKFKIMLKLVKLSQRNIDVRIRIVTLNRCLDFAHNIHRILLPFCKLGGLEIPIKRHNCDYIATVSGEHQGTASPKAESRNPSFSAPDEGVRPQE